MTTTDPTATTDPTHAPKQRGEGQWAFGDREPLNANEQLRGEDEGKLIVVNEEVGDERELLFASPAAVVREKPSKKYGA